MRRLLLLGTLFLPLLTPASALAGTCPSLPEGVVDKDSYRLGELIDFYGSYNDFADPGTVTVDFDRAADGATRSFTAGNIADGTWILRPIFTSADYLGVWDVTVVVTQTGGVDTCTDRVTIRATSSVPDTATAPEWPTTSEPALPGGPIAFAIAILSASWLTVRRFAPVPRRR